MWKTTVRLAQELGVSRQTTFRWVKAGKYDKFQKTKGGHYRVWCESEDTAVVCYCRVSSAKQASSLATQERILREAYPAAEVIKDIGSGFNFKRKGFQALLERCLRGAAITVVVTTPDRLCQDALQVVRWIIELHGGELVCLEENPESEGFDTKALLAFLTSFCASHHGKRSSSRRKKNTHLPDARE